MNFKYLWFTLFLSLSLSFSSIQSSVCICMSLSLNSVLRMKKLKWQRWHRQQQYFPLDNNLSTWITRRYEMLYFLHIAYVHGEIFLGTVVYYAFNKICNRKENYEYIVSFALCILITIQQTLKCYFVYHDVTWGINARNTRWLEAIRYKYVLRGISFSVMDMKTKIFTFTRDIMPSIIFILFYKVVLSKFKLPPDGTSTHANIFIWAQ